MRLRCDPGRFLLDLMAYAQGERLCNSSVRLLLACFPRSGSTFLASILAQLPGFQKVSLVPAYGRREQELALEWLLVTHQSLGNYVAQHHVRYSEHTGHLLALFDLQPIVLVRNIFDVVVSIRDYLKTGAAAIAQAYVPADLSSWEDERIDQFIVDLIVPWYLSFFASWSDCPDRIQLSYETLISDPAAAIARVRDRTGLRATEAEIGAAVATARGSPASTRFNVGISGRGKELSPWVVGRIRALAGYYRTLDCVQIGIDSVSAESAAQSKAA